MTRTEVRDYLKSLLGREFVVDSHSEHFVGKETRNVNSVNEKVTQPIDSKGNRGSERSQNTP